MKFTVVLAPEEAGGYSVTCPAVPGCVSQGESADGALANVKEAILLCLEVREEDRLPSPTESPEIIAKEIEERLADRKEAGLPLTIETHGILVA